eukprot:Amastigsp_a339721_97.p5 type:complete len:129 gc:universal Amastigsp_a339721_97:743-1129(+)
MLAKSAGNSSKASEDMTPSAPVWSRHRWMSSKFSIPPFAKTGMSISRLMARIASQLAARISCFFSARVRPCTVRIDAPAAWITRQRCSVGSSPAWRSRILTVTGTLSPRTSVRTIASMSAVSSRRNEP